MTDQDAGSLGEAGVLTDDESRYRRLAISEVELLLAEKRTALSLMRTGIAVFALPLSVLSILIATSRYYDMLQVVYFLVPLLLLCAALVLLGGYLVIRAFRRIRHHDEVMEELKRKHSAIANLIDRH